MIKVTSKNNILLLAALIASIQLAGAAEPAKPAEAAKPQAKPTDLFNDVVAQGKNVKITRSMLDDALVNIRSGAATRGQMIPEQQMKMLEAQVLNGMISMQILNGMATAEDKAAGADVAQKKMEILRKNVGSEENLTRQLKTTGMTIDELTTKLTEDATAKAVLERVIKFDVTDADVKKFYDENPDQFEQPEFVRAAHVLIGTQSKDGTEMDEAQKKEKRALAESVMKRAKAGEDFAKLAKEYSDDPGSKDKGGEYTFPRGQMMPAFEQAAFALQTNQVSDIVTTPYGYHIIKLYEKTPAKKVELATVAPDLKKFLKSRGIEKQIPAYMEKIEKDAGVEILDPEIKKTLDQAKADFNKANTPEMPKVNAPKAGEKK
jgi:peptidyl-prolyl cis-trans isomerase C